MAKVESFSIASFAAELKARAVTYQEEEITLRAGGKSHWYVDVKKGLSRSRMLAQAGELIIDSLNQRNIDYENVCGMGIGGEVIKGAMLAGFINTGKDISFVTANDDVSPGQRYGYGLHGGDVKIGKTLAVDDVSTTANSLITMIDMVRDGGGIVENADVLVDRSRGEAALALSNMGVVLHALLELDESSGLLVPIPATPLDQ